MLDGDLQVVAILARAASSLPRGEKDCGLVRITKRRRAGLQPWVRKNQRQTGRDHQVARVSECARMHEARVEVGGEEDLVGEAVMQRLQHQQLVVHIAGQDADGADRTTLGAVAEFTARQRQLRAATGLARLERDGQAAKVVELVTRLGPLEHRNPVLVLA